MKQIALLDTSVATRNVGDEIIMDSVRREAALMFPEFVQRSVPTHERLGARSRELLKESQVRLAGGTNLVGPPMAYHRLWKIGPAELLRSPNATLMGCGWRRYQARTLPYSRLLLNHALSSVGLHAVRDSFTAKKLNQAGIENTIVTGCPTTWQLTPEHIAKIPPEKGEAAIIVLNGKKDPIGFGVALLTLATKLYDRVYFWPQMVPDMRYEEKLPEGIVRVNPTLEAYDRVLREEDKLDYLGSRLHAGIRALQHSRRTFIFELDNRATEMGKSLSLPTVPTQVDERVLTDLIETPQELRVRIPADKIAEWKEATQDVASRAL